MLILNNIDQEVLESIHDNSFPIPIVRNPLYISKKTAIDNGQLIGSAMVKLTAEGILILDQNQPLVTRARAAKELIEALKQDIKMQGLNDCHVFVKKEAVRKFLKHLGFMPCQGGDPMVIHF